MACWYFPVSKERITAVLLLQPPAPELIHTVSEKNKATPQCLQAGGQAEESILHKPHYAALHTRSPTPNTLSLHKSWLFPPSKTQSNVLVFSNTLFLRKKPTFFFLLQYCHFPGALEGTTQGKSFFWEMLCQSSHTRLFLFPSNKCRTRRWSLSGAPAILP